MSSRLLSFSLGLNLVLFGVAGYWALKRHSRGSTQAATASVFQTNHSTESNLELAPAASAVAMSPAPLRWDELESENFATYVANLRKAGCPEPVLRRIISGELKELYAQKAFTLVQKFHADFWKIAARENVPEYFEKRFGQQVKALYQESDALLKQLVGEASGETESEQNQILSAEERSEYQLRQSSAASELQQLYGVDFSETELRKIAKVIDDYHRQTESQAETNPEQLEQKLQAVLGPTRFADFNRARSASYRELYEVASEFGQPTGTAAELFDLRLESEKQSDEIRADKNRPAEEKQALLDALQEQVEQAFLAKFGAEAYQSYKSRGGRWINSLGRF